MADASGTTVYNYDDRNLGVLQPDLVDSATQEVDEIKPLKSFLLGEATLTLELFTMNYSDPSKRYWQPGFSYVPPAVLSLKEPGVIALVSPSVGGVIPYELININNALKVISLYASLRVAQGLTGYATSLRGAYGGRAFAF